MHGSFGELLRTEIDDVAEQAAAVDQDREQIQAALDRVTATHRALEDARRELADVAAALVVRALVVGIDRTELFGRPYSPTKVRQFAQQAGLPPNKPGPRPGERGRVEEVLAELRETGGKSQP